jgi:hypothetical protein
MLDLIREVEGFCQRLLKEEEPAFDPSWSRSELE